MRAISKAFGGIPALSARRSRSRAGEVHALIGQNGAGKSTMIKILTGYVARDEGEIAFDGARVRGALAAGRPGQGHQHDLPGDQSRPLSARSPRTSASAAKAAASACSTGRRCTRRRGRLLARFQDRYRRAPAADALQHRDAADGRDRARDRLQGQARHHGRADLVARRARGQRAVRRHPAIEGDRASR